MLTMFGEYARKGCALLLGGVVGKSKLPLQKDCPRSEYKDNRHALHTLMHDRRSEPDHWAYQCAVCARIFVYYNKVLVAIIETT